MSYNEKRRSSFRGFKGKRKPESTSFEDRPKESEQETETEDP
jgi:hypothetical protein